PTLLGTEIETGTPKASTFPRLPTRKRYRPGRPGRRAVGPMTSCQSSGAPPCSMVKPSGKVADLPSGFVTTTFHDPGVLPARLKAVEITLPPSSTATGLPTISDSPIRVSLTVAPLANLLP